MDDNPNLKQEAAETRFQMIPLRNGRRYLDLIITLGVPLALLYLLPPSIFCLVFGLVLMVVLAYLFIFRRNHIITVTGAEIQNCNTITGKETTISVAEIQSVKTGLLGDLVLIDREGKKRLCVEKNMSCYDRFLAFLQAHDLSSAKD